MGTTLTIAGWLVIIAFAVFARYHLQMTYNMPTDLDRFRSWRYRRAIRRTLKRNRRRYLLARQRRP